MHTLIGHDPDAARKVLDRGGLCAIPTETVYGLAANALDAEAVYTIFEVKGRPAFDPLIVHIADASRLADHARDIPPVAFELARRFWPGPLTLVLPKQAHIPDIVTSGLDTVGLRVPAHVLTRELLRMLDYPLAAPSANPFGYISPTTAQHVADQLGGKIPYILDGGPCAVGIESTIVHCLPDGCVLLRPGGIPAERIAEVAGNLYTPEAAAALPSAPGMLEGHYAPRKPLILGDPADWTGHPEQRHIAALTFSASYPLGACEILSPSGDLNEAARRLFSAMRRLDQSDCRFIIAEVFPDEGLGRAINDRLRRAARGSGHIMLRGV